MPGRTVELIVIKKKFFYCELHNSRQLSEASLALLTLHTVCERGGTARLIRGNHIFEVMLC